MIVLDTSVVIAGLRKSTGASAEILRLVLEGQLKAAASTALLFEYEAVAVRPEHLAAANRTREEIADFLDSLAIVLQPTYIHWRVRPASPDPDDDLLIEAALNCGADYIVTSNIKDIAAPAARFGIGAITPSALTSLRKRT